MARRAGTTPATTARTSTAHTTAACVAGSVVGVSKRRPAMRRPAAIDPAVPNTAPMPVSHTAPRSTSAKTDARVAPSASLMPISGSRWLTEYQIEP